MQEPPEQQECGASDGGQGVLSLEYDDQVFWRYEDGHRNQLRVRQSDAGGAGVIDLDSVAVEGPLVCPFDGVEFVDGLHDTDDGIEVRMVETGADDPEETVVARIPTEAA